MNIVTKSSRKFSAILVGFYIIIFVCGGVIVVYNQIKHQQYMKYLRTEEINGTITYLEDVTRGYYTFKVQTLNGIRELKNMHVSHEIKKFKITVGDSISKKSNDSYFIFYKKTNGHFIKSFDYEP